MINSDCLKQLEGCCDTNDKTEDIGISKREISGPAKNHEVRNDTHGPSKRAKNDGGKYSKVLDLPQLDDTFDTEDHNELKTRVENLLNQLTLSEKVSLLSGSSLTSATGIPRLNIPTINLLDSINGIKSTNPTAPTLCFPSTTCLGSTFNPSLLYLMGKSLAIQAKKQKCNVILGPTINIHRDPRGGRNFECFSEDPLLTGILAANLMKGIQEGGVGACLKHFVGNESEFKRRFYSVTTPISSRTMREIYLAAFEYAIKECEPWAVMTAYNKIRPIPSDPPKYSSESPLLTSILRNQFSFTGCILSDWFGTRSTLPSLLSGLDLEMPGPSVFRGQKLLDAVNSGDLEERIIDERVRNVLMLILKTTAAENGAIVEQDEDEKARTLTHRIATEGIVLLKNDHGILPLNPPGGKISVIGPYALTPPINGGGSALAVPQHVTSPLSCLQATYPGKVEYSQGFTTHVCTPSLPLPLTSAKNGENGIDISYYIHSSPTHPVLQTFTPTTKITHIGFLPPP
ncbi:hypothetical protein G7Y89_g9843 [Cudoniella acicularis]|uniref:beta-glucosidase n=1 Tax=Cudoniella acicularis TaxID=354080 RepID=A0A8H4RG47_9HELO|nr:hypothetical protein G7Y89_g9843 [Cudoniella acicularis]